MITLTELLPICSTAVVVARPPDGRTGSTGGKDFVLCGAARRVQKLRRGTGPKTGRRSNGITGPGSEGTSRGATKQTLSR